MSQAYREGDWFAVPLRLGGYVVGLVARGPQRGTVLLDETRLLAALSRLLSQERPVTLDQSQWIR